MPHKSRNSGIWEFWEFRDKRGLGKDFAGWTNPFLGQYLHPSPVQSSRSIQRMQTVPIPKQILYDQLNITKKGNNFYGRTVFASQIKKFRRRFCWVDKPLLDQYLHPSPVQSSRSIQRMQTVLIPKQILYDQLNVTKKETIFMEEQSLLHRSRSSGRDFVGWTNPFLGQYLHPSPVQSSRSLQRMQTVLIPKQILYDQLNVTKKETIFMEEQSLLQRSRSKGRDFAGWTNPFLGQYLHQSPVQSSRAIQRMPTVLIPKQILYDQLNVTIRETISMKEQSLLHRSRSSGRDFAGWTNPFLGQYLHPSPVQSSSSIQHMQTVLIPKQILYDQLNVTKRKQFLWKNSLCFTYQEAQEEILLGGPTPF